MFLTTTENLKWHVYSHEQPELKGASHQNASGTISVQRILDINVLCMLNLLTISTAEENSPQAPCRQQIRHISQNNQLAR